MVVEDKELSPVDLRGLSSEERSPPDFLYVTVATIQDV